MKRFLFLIIATLLSLHPPAISAEEIKLHELEKLFVVGNFDGNGVDTLFQHNYSGLTKAEIDSAASPYQNDWETIVHWFQEQEAEVYLAFNKPNKDTLHLGAAQGLYCLINIGDNNSDGRDEIALVVDYLDYSNRNTCKIYTLCNNKWTLLKQFGIHESAFDFSNEEAPVFFGIRGYLEKHEGKWIYLDISDYDAEADEVEMKPLKLEKCR